MKNKCLIIAEAGVNHNGSLDIAKELVDAAKFSGADFVKFQTFKSNKLVTRHARKASYQTSGQANDETQAEMLKKLELSLPQFQELSLYCKSVDIGFLSTPFDLESLNEIVKLKTDYIKISSGDLTNGPLVLEAAKTQLPIILSTGMATLADIENCLGALAFGYTIPKENPSKDTFSNYWRHQKNYKALTEKVTLLHCTSEYPAPYNQVNLNAIKTLEQAFGLPCGYSDHTNGIEISLAAATLGAQVIEKHLTLDQSMEGPDHKASISPKQFRLMVDSIRNIELSMGAGIKIPSNSENTMIQTSRKSLVAKTRIKAGEQFSEQNVDVKRPGTGVSPMLFWDYIGKISEKNYDEDDLID